MLQRKWDVWPKVGSDVLEKFPFFDPLLVQLLHNRGIRTISEADAFLEGSASSAHDPYLLKDMDTAVSIIRRTIDDKALIAVYGDFDADGITSTVLLTETLASLGAGVIPYIPHRVEEGYGLNSAALRTLADRGVKLVITVDCGIGAVEEIQFGRSIGLDILITDHHSVSVPLPAANALVNPRREDCNYPCKDLAGVGVAFKLAQALLESQNSSLQEEDLLDLVALGTVADLSPLLGENRYLVTKGLKSLNNTRRAGLQEMILGAGLKPGSITTGDIGFVLGPRLNAAGRIDDAIISYDLLSTRSPQEGRRLASLLEQKNAERQRLTSEYLIKAREQAVSLVDNRKIVIISGEGYPAGIVGLIAGKLAEEYYKPFLVIEKGEQFSKGSARSIPGLDIVGALEQCKDLLVRFGGHKQAAGFTIDNDKLKELDERLQLVASDCMTECRSEPSLFVDTEIELGQMSWNTYKLVDSLAPYGFGNPQPLFLSQNVRVVDYRTVGMNSNHLRLRLSDGRGVWSAIGFRLGYFIDEITSNVDIVYSLETNDWNGNVTLQLNMKDIRPRIR